MSGSGQGGPMDNGRPRQENTGNRHLWVFAGVFSVAVFIISLSLFALLKFF